MTQYYSNSDYNTGDRNAFLSSDTMEKGLTSEWDDSTVRKGFLKKVFGLVTIQLIFTFGTNFIFSLDSIKTFVQDPANIGLYYLAFIGMFACVITISCCSNVARSYPQNYFVLALLTFFQSYMLGVITSFYDTQIVFMAEIITLSISCALTLYAIQTKYDFTDKGGYLLAALMGLLVFGILNIFIQNQFVHTIYASLGAILFSLYLVYDVQLVAGGKHRKYQLSPDEYVFAAVAIYLDIINLFLYILSLLGSRRD